MRYIDRALFRGKGELEPKLAFRRLREYVRYPNWQCMTFEMSSLVRWNKVIVT
jgi:hypothetical protein